MTPQQRAVLNFVGDYYDRHGYSPSYRDIAAWLGHASPASAHRIATALIERGHLAHESRYGGHRGLVVVDRHKSELSGVPTTALLAELERRGVSHG